MTCQQVRLEAEFPFGVELTHRAIEAAKAAIARESQMCAEQRQAAVGLVAPRTFVWVVLL